MGSEGHSVIHVMQFVIQSGELQDRQPIEHIDFNRIFQIDKPTGGAKRGILDRKKTQ